MLWLRAAKNGTRIDESMQAGENGYERVWENVKKNLNARNPANNSRGWKIERCFVAQKGLRNIAKRRMPEDIGALPREDGDLLREYHAMHEENFLSSWMREDVEGKEEQRERLNEEAEREESKRGKREVAVCPNSEVDSVWGVLGFFGVSACGASVCACGDCSFLDCVCGL